MVETLTYIFGALCLILVIILILNIKRNKESIIVDKKTVHQLRKEIRIIHENMRKALVDVFISIDKLLEKLEK
jgi:hypothetical protein